MFSHLRLTWSEINLDSLAHNMREIRRVSKAKDIIAVIKADAYGHGALDVAPVLIENGATRFAVAILNEALELRKGGINIPIIVLNYTPVNRIEEIILNNIEQTVYTLGHARQISKKAVELNKIVKIHIKIDTGMGRIGLLTDEKGLEEVCKISKLPNLEFEGLFSHFSSSDEKDKTYTNFQLNKFNDFYNSLKALGIKINIRHISNSAGIIDMEEAHFEAVRPGIILYGYYPSQEIISKEIDLKPIMTVKAKIVHIKKLPPGEYISYGRHFETEKESIIATLPIGYADGYTRLLSNKGKVILKNQYAPIVGNVCMDQCMIDVTHIPDVKNGDEVIVMGQSADCSFTAEDLANIIGTINYEILCMVSKRVPRVYIRAGKVVNIRNYV